MLLNEYAAKMGFTCETECKRLWQDGNSSGVARFVARVKLCGHLVAEEEGFSKQEASNKASVAAMGGVMEEAPSDWGQSMRSLIMGKFAELLRPETRSIVFPTVCAGIVCSMPGREPFVVSLGAGTVHVPLVERGEFPSEILHDCHAEMLCKRGLRSYFMQQLYLAQTGDQSSIFAKRPPGVMGSPYQLRPNITFHLFISSPPCGDAACCVGKVDQEGGGGRPIGVRPMHGVPSMGGRGRSLPAVEESLSQNWRGDGHWPGFGRSSTQGKLRAKLDSGESLTPLPPPVRSGGVASSAEGGNGGGAVPAKAGGVNGRMCKMSCSDKLLRMNALGIQGSLLSHFLNAPIHISSVTCGDGTDGGGGQGARRSMYCHAEIARAICCRLGRGRTDGASAIPPLVLNQPYYVNHPALHRASATAPPPPRGLETGGAGHGVKRADRAAVWSQGGKLELLCHARGGGGVSGKTPVQLLQELCQSAPGVEGAIAVWEVVVGKAGGFDAKVIALGAVGEGSGGSKVEARQKAARVLLEVVGVCFMGKGSRVSQARQFDDFKWLVEGEPEMVGEGIGSDSHGGFRGAKRGGRGYLEAKEMLMAYLEQTFEQTWIERGPIVVGVRGTGDANGDASSATAPSLHPAAQVAPPRLPLPPGAGSPAASLGAAPPSSLVDPTEV